MRFFAGTSLMFLGNTVKESRLSLLFVPSAEGGRMEIIMKDWGITGEICFL